MLCKIAFWSSSKVIALLFDNSIAKDYLHNEGGIVSLFLYGLACHILNLADKHGVTLNSAYIPIIFMYQSMSALLHFGKSGTS